MTNRHKHADLIIAWANGAEIEVWSYNEWVEERFPDWTDEKYRLKPPDIVSYAHVSGVAAHCRPHIVSSSSDNWNDTGAPSYTNPVNVKFTFDLETKALKAVEMV